MRKVGLYGGTFDPFHLGHLALAINLKERLQLDEVWLIPANLNPLRSTTAVSFEHRLAMAEEVAALIPGFCTCGIEGERPPPSYTIDTVLELKKRHPDCAFTLLLGDDASETLPHWHRIEELLALIPIVIGKRKASAEILQGEYVPTPLYEISSTEIRERLQQKKFCGHLLPQAILDYIFKHKLYTT
jgi:nicotinate-nucleotide adenylyltransferase